MQDVTFCNFCILYVLVMDLKSYLEERVQTGKREVEQIENMLKEKISP